MKKNKILTAGIAIGLVMSMSIQVFAAPAIEKIQAYINNEMTFEFNGEKKPLTDDYEVLVYKDRSYVPVRYIAENLGAEVNWNDDTKIISIKSETSTSSAVTPPAVTPPADNTAYKKLPQTKDHTNFRISATSYYEENSSNMGNKIYLTLTNNSKTGPIMLDQAKTVFTVDGKEYQVDPKDYSMRDQTWFRDVALDGEQPGFLLMPVAIKDAKNVHVEAVISSNGAYPAWSETVEFDIQLKK